MRVEARVIDLMDVLPTIAIDEANDIVHDEVDECP